MEIIQISALIAFFLVMALLMFLRKLPALIALPLMAVVIALVGGVSPADTIQYVIGAGALKLSTAYTIAILGSMLSVLLQKTGVAENFIKRGAELSGDNPWIIAVVMLSLITMLFTTIGGLGAIIMVATIVLPIMTSVGIGPMTTVGIFLFGLSMGGLMNVGNWAVYLSVMGLTIDQIRPFALLMFAISFVMALLYITIQLYRDGHNLNLKRIAVRTIVALGIVAAVAYYCTVWCPAPIQQIMLNGLDIAGSIAKWCTGVGIGALFGTALARILLRKNEHTHEVHWISFFAPVIPLFLILVFRVDIIASFVVGFIYTYLATYKKGRLSLLIQSLFDGGGIAMPAVVLMFGIGMLLVAIMGPGVRLDAYPHGWPVLEILRPLMAQIVPTNPFVYVIVFTLAAPLALYRGPLNVWGMGYGLAAVFLAAGLNPGAVMGLLLGVGPVQGISDPTNTHNVWLANEMRVDVQKVLWNTIVYTWPLAFLGLICSALVFM
ncbi:MAG: citrate transporter [Ignavibacteriales bacterium]|nr:citrate transporter [Ignavibacteriales bacterium]